MGKYIYAIFLLIFLSSCTYPQISPPYTSSTITPGSYAEGRLDAKRDYRPSSAWILAGIGCGIFGVGLAYLAPPEPPAHALVSKSPEYAVGYRDGWRQKGKAENAKYAALGWATWIVALVAAYQ